MVLKLSEWLDKVRVKSDQEFKELSEALDDALLRHGYTDFDSTIYMPETAKRVLDEYKEAGWNLKMQQSDGLIIISSKEIKNEG